MALIVLAADKGSPGVTTAAVALGAVWPTRVLVAECDPAGADLPYRLPAGDGSLLNPNRGLLSLAAAARRGLSVSQVWQHTQIVAGGLEVLVGLITAEQRGGIPELWPALGESLSSLTDADVLADCGRLGPDSPAIALLRHACLVLLVVRADMAGIAHTRDRVAALSAQLNASGADGPPLGVVLVSEPATRRRAQRQLTRLLRTAQPRAEVRGWLAFDLAGARMLAGQGRGRLDRSWLIRSARELAATLAVQISGATPYRQILSEKPLSMVTAGGEE